MSSSCHEWHVNVDSFRGDLSGNSCVLNAQKCLHLTSEFIFVVLMDGMNGW